MRAKAWRMLFAGRRWMLWLPVPASVWLALPEWQHIPAMLFGGLIVWIPFWLAWWLSDGFAGMSRWPGTGAPSVSGGVKPAHRQAMHGVSPSVGNYLRRRGLIRVESHALTVVMPLWRHKARRFRAIGAADDENPDRQPCARHPA
jgi:hypothetical protein